MSSVDQFILGQNSVFPSDRHSQTSIPLQGNGVGMLLSESNNNGEVLLENSPKFYGMSGNLEDRATSFKADTPASVFGDIGVGASWSDLMNPVNKYSYVVNQHNERSIGVTDYVDSNTSAPVKESVPHLKTVSKNGLKTATYYHPYSSMANPVDFCSPDVLSFE